MIRGKFRGRGKRDNMLANGKFILVGIRDYESGKEGKLENCDLLDVYSDQDKERLKNQVDGFDWKIFNLCESSKKNDNSESDVHFTNDTEDDYDRIMNEATKSPNKMNVIEEENDDEDEINVDDI